MILTVLMLQAVLGSVRVIDGDTIHDNHRQWAYRLAAIDAPETGGRAACAREAQLGEMARQALADILARADRVTVEPAWDPRGPARWPMSLGRRLAIVKADGEDVAPMLAARGMAVPRDEDQPFDWCG